MLTKDQDKRKLITWGIKKEVMKILKELRKAININVDYCKKELETVRRNQEKLENLFAELKAVNNAEDQLSDLEERIMYITQSEQQTESQMKKVKAI